MDLDDHTPHKFRALRDCPGGQRAGEVFETTAAMGDVLVKVGDAERVESDDEPKKSKAYKRRDLRAEE